MSGPASKDAQPSLDAGPASNRIGRGQWMALTAALLGWMFDGAEMGVFSIIGRPALKELLRDGSGSAPPEDILNVWFAIIMAGFLVGAATGGVLFGWLGDRIGRVRAMTLSVITYAVFTGCCGLVGSAWQMGVLRFLAALGMGGEWSLGVALVMEVWPNRSRAFMAGLIGAAGNFGYLLVGIIGLGLESILADLAQWFRAAGLAEATVVWLTDPPGWRILMLLGATPALLTFLIRLFVPESERWLHQKATGAVSHWATRDLLGVLVGALGPAMIIYLWAWPFSIPVRLAGSIAGLLLATAGYTYPVIRFLQRQSKDSHEHALAYAWRPTLRRMLLAAGLSGVALLGTWGAAQWAPAWADKLAGSQAKYYTQIWMACGAVLGTLLAAMMGDWLGRKRAYALLCVAAMISLLVLYRGNTEYGNGFLASAFAVGVCTASFYGWLPLYLPELFRTKVRATGQGFGFNFGRILAAIGTLQTGSLFAERIHIGGWDLEGGYPLACSAMSMIYLVGLVLICFAPETRGRPLPD